MQNSQSRLPHRGLFVTRGERAAVVLGTFGAAKLTGAPRGCLRRSFWSSAHPNSRSPGAGRSARPGGTRPRRGLPRPPPLCVLGPLPRCALGVLRYHRRCRTQAARGPVGAEVAASPPSAACGARPFPPLRLSQSPVPTRLVPPRLPNPLPTPLVPRSRFGADPGQQLRGRGVARGRPRLAQPAHLGPPSRLGAGSAAAAAAGHSTERRGRAQCCAPRGFHAPLRLPEESSQQEVTNKKPAQASITKVKQFEGSTSFVRRTQWMLEQLRQVNGIDPNRDSPEFDLLFENAFDQWVASTASEKCTFFQILHSTCQRYLTDKKPEFINCQSKIMGGNSILHSAADSVTSAVQKASQALNERGERLGRAEEKTEELKNSAQQFAETAHKLAMKHKC
uniref:Uncharacterized protein n=1 Tax=Melopsittacus undulatus TaxID=13146 RepID=A0A8V5GMA5_MELUD